MDSIPLTSTNDLSGNPVVSRVFRNHWRAIALLALLGAVATLGWSMLQPKVYTSSSTGLVVAVGEADLSSALAGNNLAQSKALSYESLAVSRPVAESVVRDLGLSTPPETLLAGIEAEASANTAEVVIRAEAPTPEGSADLANAWIGALAEQVNVLESFGTDDGGATSVALRPLGEAFVPSSPSSPDFLINIALGMLGGLGLGVLYAFVINAIERSHRWA